ncbi:MAG: UDP-N-acetylmuramoyl-tripeptide--D-alanyl-D-alanine ligase [bacterium]
MALKFLLIAACLPWLIKTYFNGLTFVHVAQLEGYRWRKLAGWLKKQSFFQLVQARDLVMGAALSAITGIACFFPPSFPALATVTLLWFAGPVYLILTRPEVTSKKPLNLTPRAVRLTGMFKFLTLVETVWLINRCFSPVGSDNTWVMSYSRGMPSFWGGFWLIGLLSPVNVLLANIFIQPLENRINKYYFRKSSRKVRSFDELKIIGITGSYGKTSVKYILHTILSAAYPTLMTPESYNTPMGISKVIQNDLNEDYDYFIVEMGARQRNDIQELCRLTPPHIGIITTIGQQHLETFKSLENIARTKGDLVRALPKDGLAVLNFDNPPSLRIKNLKAPVVGIGIENREADLRASNIHHDENGLKFLVKDRRTGEEAEFVSRLLGRQNVYNFLSATAAALALGLDLSFIARRVTEVRPVPHRLEMIKGEGGVIVIDDAFNANPAGAGMALEVLKTFETGRRLLITPGLVELGENQEQENLRLGELAAQACDYIMLVGEKQTAAIACGLRKQGFTDFSVCADLDEAVAEMQAMVQAGDVVLFENDLPDLIFDQ